MTYAIAAIVNEMIYQGNMGCKRVGCMFWICMNLDVELFAMHKTDQMHDRGRHENWRLVLLTKCSLSTIIVTTFLFKTPQISIQYIILYFVVCNESVCIFIYLLPCYLTV